MGLEAAAYIDGLVSTNPLGSDQEAQGDDHIRLLKATIKATLPNLTGAMTATQAELNFSVGVTSLVQAQLDAKASLASSNVFTLSQILNNGSADTPEITYSDDVNNTHAHTDVSGEKFRVLGEYQGAANTVLLTVDLDTGALWAKGDITSDGSAGTVGSVDYSSGSTVWTGYLKINGAELSRITYAGLWAFAQAQSNYTTQVIKDGDVTAYAGFYGDGDGSTTFTIPDWRGMFMRMWDDAKGLDTGRGLGSHQAQNTNKTTVQTLAVNAALAVITPPDDTGTVSGYALTGRNDGGNRGMRMWMNNTETRSQNISLMPLLKY